MKCPRLSASSVKEMDFINWELQRLDSVNQQYAVRESVCPSMENGFALKNGMTIVPITTTMDIA